MSQRALACLHAVLCSAYKLKLHFLTRYFQQIAYYIVNVFKLFKQGLGLGFGYQKNNN